MTPVRFVFSLILSVWLVMPCWSQITSNPWSFPKYKQSLITTKNFPQKHTIVQINEEILASILDQAPLRFSEEARTEQTILSLPSTNGNLEEFIIVEAPVLHPDLGKKYPNIRSYAGQSISDPTATARFSWSPKGFEALVLRGGETSIIDTYTTSNRINHIVYKRKDRTVPSSAFECTVRRHEESNIITAHSRSQQAGDCQLRTYRLALACTGEYTSYHGGSTADALAAMNASITRINGVFENELTVSLQIIPENTRIIFLNSDSDPYDNFDGGNMLDQNQVTIDRIIGSRNYDVGHVFSTGGGGIAGLGVVCLSGEKAGGVTGSPEPEGDLFDIDFVAHELGHQFGAEHTFNGNNGACAGNSWRPTAVEPGGGSTIMAYAGICDDQNVQNKSDVYFHAKSIEEISKFLSAGGNGCAQITDLNNDGPLADAGQDYIIPKSTPFVLSGVGSDPNGETLTYNWEQMDTESSTQPPRSTNSGGPLFRSHPPTTSVDRFFPDLRFLARNLDNRWEVLPSVARELNFRFMVRDNNIGGGCTAEDDMEIIVNDRAGPFLVIAPNTKVNWIGGSKEVITWDVANTTASPINTSLVDILLSVDGGLSFTQTILTNTPNTGTAEIIVPNVATSAARIMVRASGNIFFDISDRNFIIEPIRDDFFVIVEESSLETCTESPVSYKVNVDVSGSLNGTVDLSTTGLPNGVGVTFSNNNFIPPSNVNLTLTPDGTVAPGTYDFELNVIGTTGIQSRNLSFTIVNTASNLVLESPKNGSNAVEPTAVFAWNVFKGAEKYTLEIATNPTFSNSISYTDITTNVFSIPVALPTNTRFYWKVITTGPCFGNKESETYTFLTSNIACKIFKSVDTPIEISSVGSPTIVSTISVPDEGIVMDVNILNLQIDHSFVSDIAVGLRSPEEDLAILLLFPCIAESNVDINFDDEEANSYDNIPCPPTDGGRYNPLDALSVFDGSDVIGDWSLIINDDANDDGGRLNSWSLEVCFLQETLVTALSVNAMKTDETCFGKNDGTAGVNVLDGTGNYTFLWSNGATDPRVDQLSPGMYTVTVSDGVTDIVDSMTIAAASEITRSFEVANQSCSDIEDGQIMAISKEGVELEYLWPDNSNGSTFSNLRADVYEVIITERTSGCSISERIEVSAPNPILIRTLIQDVSCVNASDGSILPTVIGGLPPYSINELINIPAGDYTVQVTDANNCVERSMVSIIEPSPITIDLSSSPISMVDATDGVVTATANGGNGPYSYTWSNTSNRASISNLAEGVYEVTVTDQNGCLKTASAMIAGIECSTIFIMLTTEQITTLNGANGSISAAVSNGQGLYTYLWSTGATTAIIADLAPSTYSVTVTDEKGCTATQIAELTGVQCSPFSIMFDTEEITIVGGTDGRIIASVNNEKDTYTYLWSTGATTDTITDLSVGTYSVTVTDEKGCAATQIAELTGVQCSPISIMFNTEEITVINETNGRISASVSNEEGTYSYLWSTGAATDTIIDLPVGTYSVTVTDEKGCTATQSVELNRVGCAPISIRLNTEEITLVNGTDGRISASVSNEQGVYTYLWSTGATTDTITDLSVGAYSVTVTDENGCTGTQTGELNGIQCIPFSITLNTDDIMVVDGTDGRISASVSNKESPYTYLWSTGATTDTIMDLSAGTYDVTVTYENGCTGTQTVELKGVDCAPFNIDFAIDGPNCDETVGSITAMVTGGNGPYTYNWSIESKESEITDIDPGSYSVTVTDVFGCFSAANALMTEAKDITPPIIECPEDRVILNACNFPVIYELVATDDCGMVRLELIQGLESGVEFPQGETLVEYMASDTSGNTATCNFRVTNSTDISIEYNTAFLLPDTGDEIVFTYDLKCGDPDTLIADFLIVNGGMPPYAYSVLLRSNGGAATNYSVGISDGAGCLYETQVYFLNTDDTQGITSPVLDAVIKDDSIGIDGSISINIDDRFEIASYLWTNNNDTISTTQNLENVEGGTYNLEITDQFGCTYTSDYEIQKITTSTNKFLLEETVNILPNPTTGNFQIQIDLPNPIAVTVDLYDVNGRLLQAAIKQENTSLPIDINISHYPKGIYLAKISAEQEVIVMRVVLL